LTVNWAFPLTAIAGLIAFQIYRKPLGLTRVRPLDKEQIILDHVIQGELVHYGIWILFDSLAYSIATLLYPSLIGGFIGLEQAGAYRAMQNLVSPLQQMLAALTFLILPIVSRQVTEQGKEHSRQASRKLGYIYLAVSVVYMALLLVFGRWIIRVLYAQETYLQYYWLFFYIGIATMLFSLSQTLAIHLRAIENTRSIFWSKLFPAVFILLIGIYLTWRMGLTGVVISMIASSLLELAVLLFFVSKVSKPVVEGSL
jgi:O-antigen/teichoic acid export membrane protein